MVTCGRYKRGGDFVWRVMRHGKQRRIGLYGGSFNPVHQGHWQCAESLRKSLKLHQVWWVVSPHNPLKLNKNISNQRIETRCRAVQQLLHRHRGKAKRHRLVTLQQAHRFIYTIDWLKPLVQRSHYRFYWLAGSDIVPQIPRWKHGLRLSRYVRLCFFNRPSNTVLGATSPARRHVYRYVRGRKNALSSTLLRQKADL